MRPRAYHKLWDLAVELLPLVEPSGVLCPEGTLDCPSVGLILHQKVGRATYRATPLNVDTFAYTGGDGVHYSFLQLEDRLPEELPIVMTVPMARKENWNFVVGADLIEFLSLGCNFGYFSLEQLAYNWVGTVAELQSKANAYSASPTENKLRLSLNDRFGLRPWPDVQSRLRELRTEFLHHIRLPEPT